MSIEHGSKDESLVKHRQLVTRGLFDAIPQTELSVGQPVAIRQTDKLYQVIEVDNQLGRVVVGYDREDEQIRYTLPDEDVRDAEGYSNAYMKFLGIGKEFHLTAEKDESTGGVIVTLWDKPRLN